MSTSCLRPQGRPTDRPASPLVRPCGGHVDLSSRLTSRDFVFDGSITRRTAEKRRIVGDVADVEDDDHHGAANERKRRRTNQEGDQSEGQARSQSGSQSVSKTVKARTDRQTNGWMDGWADIRTHARPAKT